MVLIDSEKLKAWIHSHTYIKYVESDDLQTEYPDEDDNAVKKESLLQKIEELENECRK